MSLYTESFTTKYAQFKQTLETFKTTNENHVQNQDEDSIYKLIILLANKIIEHLGDVFPELQLQPQFVVTGMSSNKTITVWQAVPTSMHIPQNLFFQQSASTINEEEACVAKYFYRLAKYAGTEHVLAPVLALLMQLKYNITCSCQVIEQYSLYSTPLVRLMYGKKKYKEIQLTKFLNTQDGLQQTLGLCIEQNGNQLTFDLHKCLACEGDEQTLYKSVSTRMHNVYIRPPLQTKNNKTPPTHTRRFFTTSSSVTLKDKQSPVLALFLLYMNLEQQKQSMFLNAMKTLIITP